MMLKQSDSSSSLTSLINVSRSGSLSLAAELTPSSGRLTRLADTEPMVHELLRANPFDADFRRAAERLKANPHLLLVQPAPLPPHCSDEPLNTPIIPNPVCAEATPTYSDAVKSRSSHLPKIHCETPQSYPALDDDDSLSDMPLDMRSPVLSSLTSTLISLSSTVTSSGLSPPIVTSSTVISPTRMTSCLESRPSRHLAPSVIDMDCDNGGGAGGTGGGHRPPISASQPAILPSPSTLHSIKREAVLDDLGGGGGGGGVATSLSSSSLSGYFSTGLSIQQQQQQQSSALINVYTTSGLPVGVTAAAAVAGSVVATRSGPPPPPPAPLAAAAAAAVITSAGAAGGDSGVCHTTSSSSSSGVGVGGVVTVPPAVAAAAAAAAGSVIKFSQSQLCLPFHLSGAATDHLQSRSTATQQVDSSLTCPDHLVHSFKHKLTASPPPQTLPVYGDTRQLSLAVDSSATAATAAATATASVAGRRGKVARLRSRVSERAIATAIADSPTSSVTQMERAEQDRKARNRAASNRWRAKKKQVECQLVDSLKQMKQSVQLLHTENGQLRAQLTECQQLLQQHVTHCGLQLPPALLANKPPASSLSVPPVTVAGEIYYAAGRGLPSCQQLRQLQQHQDAGQLCRPLSLSPHRTGHQ